MRKRKYAVLLWVLLAAGLGLRPVFAQETSSVNPAETSEVAQEQGTAVTTPPSTLESISTTEPATNGLPASESDTSRENWSDLQAQPEGIIDTDNQFLVQNTTLDPYRKIVRLESFFESGPLYGTGVLVGPDLVLTAAHNVYNVESGQWTLDLRITPAQNGVTEPYGIYQGSRVFILKNYQTEVTGANDSYDMAVIKLTEPVNSQIGYLSLSTDITLGSRVQVAGYPVSSDWKISFMYAMWGEVSKIDGNLIHYQIDTESGQSGSPVLNEKNEIVAIHTLGFIDRNQVYTHNAARLVKQDSLDMLAIAKGEQPASDAVVSHWLTEIPVYRLYHPGVQRHLYTQDQNERSVLQSRGWNDEGENFKSADHGIAVYRLYSPVTKEHLYTTSITEREALMMRGWHDEEIAWYSQGETPVYRLYHTGLKVHLYTSDSNERRVLIQRGWLDENIAWYAL